jgi:hypothetical protein
MFFVQSHESNFLIVIEMVQLVHIQYMTNYFIKFAIIWIILKVYLHFAIYHYLVIETP